LWGKCFSINHLQCLKLAPRNAGARATLTIDELRRFLAVTIPHRRYRLCNYELFFKLLALTGCRPGELVKLQPKHISWAEGCLYFVDTKTHDTRKVPIPENCFSELQKEVNKHQNFIFPTTPQQWGVAYHYRLSLCNIDRPLLSTYSLRHTYITLQLQNPGVNLFDVQSVVGHKSSQTTQQYYHLCLDRLKRVINSHPLIKSSVESKVRLIGDFIRSMGIEYEPIQKKVHGGISITLFIKNRDHKLTI
jgi:integrase